ncbi:hypothetical protein [Pseudoalteromonas sp. JB197]|uniref:hypothetical protein n=1 Tax=Pseudoalteromonas sp. JB197 TaxID=1434839 RepID=UPI00097EBD87|nr:hypothetical protein [Pseudoalteromonas sp. JB197]PCC14337.1 hypothetical protein CIK86_14420 [Pseudoalteromonas sp. JB197]SJN44743.1 conserved protein of unknown function [Pseudoalteromonas sp. JB197]
MNITVAVIINGPKRKVWAAITDIENSANMLSLTAAEPSTCLTMTFSDSSESIWVKMLSAVIGFFLKSSMRKMLKKDLDEIKHYVESKK